MPFHTCCHFLLGELSASCVNPRGEDSWKLAPGFPQTLFHAPFPFAKFALYPFTDINHSHESDYMLSPVSPLRESLNLGWSWVPLAQRRSRKVILKKGSHIAGYLQMFVNGF